MSFMKLFGGSSPAKLEQKGDALLADGQWGRAKLEYERALQKRAKGAEADAAADIRLEAKILEARNGLARKHRQAAEDLIEGGYFNEARDMLALALEVAADANMRQELEQALRDIETRPVAQTKTEPPNFALAPDQGEHKPETFVDGDEEEYFLALCGTLPEEVQEAYLSYDVDFKAGYIALNRGDFQSAAELLARALVAHDDPTGYIPLELATAYLNLGRVADARDLLEAFLKQHPETLPAYQLLCDIYWDQKAFQKVDELLGSVPAELAESLAVVLLRGETLYRAGRLEAARTFYLGFLNTYGWNESVARELAKIHETLGETDRARALYKEVMSRCNSCQSRVDPNVKHKYAELSFAAGQHGSDLVELYLALVREIPDQAPEYFDRVSRIYAAQGNSAQARHFRALVERFSADRKQ